MFFNDICLIYKNNQTKTTPNAHGPESDYDRLHIVTTAPTWQDLNSNEQSRQHIRTFIQNNHSFRSSDSYVSCSAHLATSSPPLPRCLLERSLLLSATHTDDGSARGFRAPHGAEGLGRNTRAGAAICCTPLVVDNRPIHLGRGHRFRRGPWLCSQGCVVLSGLRSGAWALPLPSLVRTVGCPMHTRLRATLCRV